MAQFYTAEDLANFAALGAGGGSSQGIQIANQCEDIINTEHAITPYELNAVYEVPVKDGTFSIGHFEASPTTPAVSETAIQTVSNVGQEINPYNSNSTEIVRGSVKQVYNTSIDSQTGNVVVSKIPKSGSFGANALYVLGEINAAATAVSVGTSLGKVVGSQLYEANPDFWSGIEISQMDATWWDRIISDNPYNAYLMNAIFGIDVNGDAQAYVNEDAFAYLAQYMAQQGVFNPLETYGVQKSDMVNVLSTPNVTQPISFSVGNNFLYTYYWSPNTFNTLVAGTHKYMMVHYSGNSIAIILASDESFTYGTLQKANSIPTYNEVNKNQTSNSFRYNNKTVYYAYFTATVGRNITAVSIPNTLTTSGTGFDNSQNIAWLMVYGSNIVSGGGIDGITNQEDATLPNVDNWTTPQNTLSSLQNQYPDLWNDALVYDVPDADGNLQPQTWVPVPWPQITPNVNPWLDTQPTTDTDVGTQAQTKVNLRTAPDTATQPLTTVATVPVTNVPDPTPQENPSDTGSGDSPTPVAPTGSASALWSVYHPTQGQINSFGAWLWGSVFTTDIRKLFEDPIQGVIKLHKVFATPVDAGTGTIVVGTLDSNVSSATVTQQYVEIDCGSVDCHEDFGNVFDYPPYTEVSLYLPFIGIVPLDVNDVMRSTINIKYGVDVFTGACLAMVYVTRDANTVNMYQYAGVCSVDYPLSNVQASGMLNGLLAVAGGVASVALSGGVGLGAAAAIAGGAANMAKKNVGRSGGFSGNSGAMGIKKPYLIIQRPQTKVAQTFPRLEGYPTNHSIKLSSCSGHVVVSAVHVEGVGATKSELIEIEEMLKSGVLV